MQNKIIHRKQMLLQYVFSFQVMTISKYKTLYTLLIVFVIVSSGNTDSLQSTLCEKRCESATPYLITLKTLWHRMSKRIGRQSKLKHIFWCHISSIQFIKCITKKCTFCLYFPSVYACCFLFQFNICVGLFRVLLYSNITLKEIY